MSAGRFFTTSVPRWNVPTQVKGKTRLSLDVDAIKASRGFKGQYKMEQKAVKEAHLEAVEAERIAARNAEYAAETKFTVSHYLAFLTMLISFGLAFKFFPDLPRISRPSTTTCITNRQ